MPAGNRLGGEAPGDLWIAEAIGRRERRDLERPDLDHLPGLHHLHRKAALVKRGFRFPDQGDLGRRAQRSLGPEHRGVLSKRALQRDGVGMVAVQMRQQTRVDRARLRRPWHLPTGVSVAV